MNREMKISVEIIRRSLYLANRDTHRMSIEPEGNDEHLGKVMRDLYLMMNVNNEYVGYRNEMMSDALLIHLMEMIQTTDIMLEAFLVVEDGSKDIEDMNTLEIGIHSLLVRCMSQRDFVVQAIKMINYDNRCTLEYEDIFSDTFK